MEYPDVQRLRHIQMHCENIEETAARFGREEAVFQRDDDYYRSVAMSVLQIGELVGGLSDAFRDETAQEIPWRDIRGFRNVVAHRYSTVRRDIVWKVVTVHIPALQRFCEEILAGENAGD